MAEQEATLRDELTSAFDQAETPEVETPVVETPAPPEGKPTEEVEAKKDDTPPLTEEEKVREETKSPLRQPDGKFAKKEGQPKVDAPPKEEPPPQLGKFKAPSSWRPALREKWASLPAEVQQEVLKRERDISNGFNEIGKLKRFGEEFAEVITPYQHIIAAEGGNPLQVVRNLMTTAAALYNGSPQQKVATVAAMINNFGIDLQMLDSYLASGQLPAGAAGGGVPPAAAGGQDISRMVEMAVSQALAPVLRGQQAQTQQMQEQLNNEIDAFANNPENEFFEDVRETMADVLELAAKRGEKVDLPTAYQRAILMHNEIADVVAERNLRKKAEAASAAAAAAKKKAVSITGAPAKEPAARGNSVRDALVSAIDSLGT